MGHCQQCVQVRQQLVGDGPPQFDVSAADCAVQVLVVEHYLMNNGCSNRQHPYY
jgi:hypothetical protein